MSFMELNARELKVNPFAMLHEEWALVSAGGLNDSGTGPRTVLNNSGTDPRTVLNNSGTDPRTVLNNSGTDPRAVLNNSGTDPRAVLSYNTMTVSWGMMGTMWNKPVAMVFIRPQRYTKEFVDRADSFTLSFYPKEYKKALGLLGSKSGRDGDKIGESGLTPYFLDDTVAFEEAHTILVCRKLFGDQPLDAAKFVDLKLAPEFYPDQDFHHMYFGEVIKVLTKE